MGIIGKVWEKKETQTKITCMTKEASYLTKGYLEDNGIKYVSGFLVHNNKIVYEFVFYEGLDGNHCKELTNMFKKLGI